MEPTENAIITEDLNAEAPDSPKKGKKAGRVSRRVAVFGTFILIFAIIGFIATVIAASRLTVSLIENNGQKELIKKAVLPLVILDPPSFDSIDQLDSRTILAAGMWDFIIFADKAKYPKDDMNNITVPSVDIETHINKMFGKDAAIEHQELSDSELQILYDEENKAYSIPAAASMISYIPEIDTVEKKGDMFTVKVGYVPSGPVWGSDITGKKYQPEPDKYLQYILKKVSKDNYIITAVKDLSSDPMEFPSGDDLPTESEDVFSDPEFSSEPASSGSSVSTPDASSSGTSSAA